MFSLATHLESRGLEPCCARVVKRSACFTVPWVWGFTAVRVRVVQPKTFFHVLVYSVLHHDGM